MRAYGIVGLVLDVIGEACGHRALLRRGVNLDVDVDRDELREEGVVEIADRARQ
jgi:hypothetical protein